jgi:hypothetical protein
MRRDNVLPDRTSLNERPVTPLEIAVSIVVLGTFGFILWQSASFPRLAKIFPLLIGVAGAIIGLLQVLADFLRYRRPRSAPKKPKGTHSAAYSAGDTGPALGPVMWIGGYFAAIVLFGFLLGSGLYVLLALRVNGRLNWFRSFSGALTISLFVFALVHFLDMDLPVGVLGF